MASLKWSTSHAVFVPELDGEHQEIFEAIGALENAIHCSPRALREPAQTLATALADHFAHEERLMRAARYGLMRWHKEKHSAARKRVRQQVRRIEQGDAHAATELVEYLTPWLHDHTRFADQMLGSFLRNHRRGLYKITFRAATSPSGAGDPVNTNGDRSDPSAGQES